MRRLIASLALALAATSAGAQMDPDNPSCPKMLDWSNKPAMTFTPMKKDGRTVLIGEGAIDADVAKHLAAALEKNKPVDEIWLRSSGGIAIAGNDAGQVIRKAGIPTRIPAGWACFSACNFVFMGGPIRAVDPGGQFVVHMFTQTADGGVTVAQAQGSYDQAVETIGSVEQNSAMLASEDNDFLIRMGVSRKLLTEVMYRQKAVKGTDRDHSTRRCLTQDELFRYNVANYR